jgi:hypothetical protein
MGYGVEMNFTLTDTAYKNLTEAINKAKDTSGSLSIFGAIYGNSGKSTNLVKSC